uniref:Putative nonribosomal peptide synthetase-like protein n=1 Tax=Paecilomyces divaricatus TaxID=644132 RepID=A0A3G1IHJ1_PAEDI|nr:putative nonribosomal peptide synthetase-like protein [Paecilomyces divaricatus]
MGSSTFEHDSTPEYGKRFLPHMIDERAASGHSRPYAYIARSPHPQDGFEEVSYARLANAINRASWWVVNELTPLTGENGVFAYMGPNDLRYLILSVAAIKTGRKMLQPSMRNTVEAQQLLFQRIGCKTIAYAATLEKSLHPIFTSISGLQTKQAPSLEDFLSEDVVPHFEYKGSYEKLTDEPLIYFHTSGSSGNPKPIGFSLRWLLLFSDAPNLPPINSRPSTVKEGLYRQNTLCFLPPFHAGGFGLAAAVVYFEAIAVCPHPEVAPTAEYILSLLDQNIATALSVPPSLLDALSKTSAGIEALSKLEHVGYVGGPLPEHVGQALAPKLKHLYSLMGATECGWFHTIPGDSSKWAYLRFNPDIGYRFDEISEGVFELVIPNSPVTRKVHGTPHIFPELNEYRTRDLYSLVPGEEGWMRYQGRSDDLIVLSNGEKINPVPLEGIINSHSAIKGALIVGEYRFLPSLLIEVQDDFSAETEEERLELLDKIWPTVEQANKIAPRFSRVPKSLIYLGKKDEHFHRAGKGTIQRQRTVSNFAKALDELYFAAEQGLLVEGLELDDPSNKDSIRAFTRKLYAQALDAEEIKDEDDVFNLGIDSLQVAITVQKIRATMRARPVELDHEQINGQLIYSNPTAGDLATALNKLVNCERGVPLDGSLNGVNERSTRLQQLLDKYIAAMPTMLDEAEKANTGRSTVILTGSTGSLGSYLLTTLLSSPAVSKVVCLNRSSDSEKRQRAIHNARGQAISWEKEDRERVEFLTADLSKPDLGLGDQKYSDLLSEASAIIHCSWKVDFNHTLSSFEATHIAGVINLITLSAKSAHHAPIMFVSSISTVFNWIETHPNLPVPEAILNDLDSSEKLGYGESKYIGERLIEAYTASTGIQNVVLRVGQIAGPVLSSSGFWNKQEWFPSLVASSKHLGLLPESLGTMNTIDWIPVDLLASIITQLLQSVHNSPESEVKSPAVYNLVNPRVTTWPALLHSVQEDLGGQSNVRVVPLSEWVEALERSASHNHGYVIAENPAVKLLDFFKLLGKNGEGNVGEAKSQYKVARLLRDSPQARQLGFVSPEWMRMWLKQWKL